MLVLRMLVLLLLMLLLMPVRFRFLDLVLSAPSVFYTPLLRLQRAKAVSRSACCGTGSAAADGG